MRRKYLNKPNWIVLQPIDKILFYNKEKTKLKHHFNLEFVLSKGSVYLPPLLYKLEPLCITDILNYMKLSFLSFHPVLVFKKIRNEENIL